jgi:ParB/Sulfiredoxin domain
MTALLALDQAEERLRPFSRRYLGIHAIPVTGIVGTDSRSTDFDREFRPLRPELRSRRQRLAERFPEGQFPPIVVTKLGDAYFVVDGHHRVAVARRLGMATIDAEVTELQAFRQLGPDADVVELLHGEQHRIFMEESGLAEVAPPDVCISFSRLTAYRELLDSVASHGYRLMRERGRVLEPRDVAADWYQHVYLGALETPSRRSIARAWSRRRPRATCSCASRSAGGSCCSSAGTRRSKTPCVRFSLRTSSAPGRGCACCSRSSGAAAVARQPPTPGPAQAPAMVCDSSSRNGSLPVIAR